MLAIVAFLVFYGWYKSLSEEKKTQLKKDMLAQATGCSVGREIIGCSTRNIYEEKVMDKDFDKDKLIINEGVEDKKEDKDTKKYTNIALFGIDSRGSEFDAATHSDTIIIVSINNDTKEVKMMSVYRDTMLKVFDKDGNYSYTKANGGFFKGGAAGAVSMLNANLDLDITDYAVVNFSGLIKIIDALGGIDVNITEDERFYINGYMTETKKITGAYSPDVMTSGNVHLDGLQATAYCRIRYVTYHDEQGNAYIGDLGRTARQRFVLDQLFAKAKQAGTTEIVSMVNSILNYNSSSERILMTSLSFDEIMDLVPTVLELNLAGSSGFPVTLSCPTINGASYVVANGLEYNVKKLHQFLFDDDDYEPTAAVKEISDYIINYSGCYTKLTPEDEALVNEQETTS